MTYEQRIKIATAMIKKLEKELPNMQRPAKVDVDELRVLSLEISFLKEIREESMHKIGIMTDREQHHEEIFYGRR